MEMPQAIGSSFRIGPVVVAALASFLVGGLWYSPVLFGKAWMAANGFTDKDLEGGNPAVIFGGAFVLALVIATVLAGVVGRNGSLSSGAVTGAVLGLGVVAAAIVIVGLFERKPPALLLINGGYQLVTLTLMGAILGAWK
jgi:uncharacterized protein DUF1761